MLLDAIAIEGGACEAARVMLDEFATVFKQSNEQFLMVDLGGEEGVVAI